MTSRRPSAFFAYADRPQELGRTISAAIESANLNSKVQATAWPSLPVFGASIPHEVQTAISDCEVVVSDVSKPNPNVYYEFGLAIGLGKAVAPVVNISFEDAVSHLQRDGIFDTIGYREYQNSAELSEILRALPTQSLGDLYSKPPDKLQPVFFLDTARKTDFRNAISSALGDEGDVHRAFDPEETPRLSTVTLIGDISSSSGVIVPILNDGIFDAARHNIRAAFVTGLAHGFGRETLLLKMQIGDTPSPADFRDRITTVRNEGQIDDIVKTFVKQSVQIAKTLAVTRKKTPSSLLQTLKLGSTSAERESASLGNYFVETAEYLRTQRGEAGVVAGRKGSGKTAIFYRVRDTLQEERRSIIIDLKPESNQLSLFRSTLLELVEDAGVFEHTLAAFWYFLIVTEALLALKNHYSARAKIDAAALSAYNEIAEIGERLNLADHGDFTTRIYRLIASISQELSQAKAAGHALSPDRLTNIVYRSGAQEAKALVLRLTPPNVSLALLFDNIDKGWPSAGVHEFDIRLLRVLLEALGKVERDFAAQRKKFHSVVFLRNDVLELLVGDTPDRGKGDHVRIDWNDTAKLKQVVFLRLRNSTGDDTSNFNALWTRFFPEKIGHVESFEYFASHSLMRPRFLLNLLDLAVSNGINRGHAKVEEDDVIAAVRQHANYLIDDFGYEIRDVSGIPADILYSLIGVTQLLTKPEVLEKFADHGLSAADSEKAFHLLLWYGVLGIADSGGRERFIYDYDYNMKRLEAEVRAQGADTLYVANNALHIGLAS